MSTNIENLKLSRNLKGRTIIRQETYKDRNNDTCIRLVLDDGTNIHLDRSESEDVMM